MQVLKIFCVVFFGLSTLMPQYALTAPPNSRLGTDKKSNHEDIIRKKICCGEKTVNRTTKEVESEICCWITTYTPGNKRRNSLNREKLLRYVGWILLICVGAAIGIGVSSKYWFGYNLFEDGDQTKSLDLQNQLFSRLNDCLSKNVPFSQCLTSSSDSEGILIESIFNNINSSGKGTNENLFIWNENHKKLIKESDKIVMPNATKILQKSQVLRFQNANGPIQDEVLKLYFNEYNEYEYRIVYGALRQPAFSINNNFQNRIGSNIENRIGLNILNNSLFNKGSKLSIISANISLNQPQNITVAFNSDGSFSIPDYQAAKLLSDSAKTNVKRPPYTLHVLEFKLASGVVLPYFIPIFNDKNIAVYANDTSSSGVLFDAFKKEALSYLNNEPCDNGNLVCAAEKSEKATKLFETFLNEAKFSNLNGGQSYNYSMHLKRHFAAHITLMFDGVNTGWINGQFNISSSDFTRTNALTKTLSSNITESTSESKSGTNAETISRSMSESQSDTNSKTISVSVTESETTSKVLPTPAPPTPVPCKALNQPCSTGICCSPYTCQYVIFQFKCT